LSGQFIEAKNSEVPFTTYTVADIAPLVQYLKDASMPDIGAMEIQSATTLLTLADQYNLPELEIHIHTALESRCQSLKMAVEIVSLNPLGAIWDEASATASRGTALEERAFETILRVVRTPICIKTEVTKLDLDELSTETRDRLLKYILSKSGLLDGTARFPTEDNRPTLCASCHSIGPKCAPDCAIKCTTCQPHTTEA